ncbi:MAG: primosomal protein N' [Omnitrophica WOR_2 bacterium RIFCSPLOWO2_12_FULL_50_9]|nr:MAG: primosomal protein N' [Omnitrophica WOR_2 bacterium RIFCSPLOWO2_12_FULL_50_9]
MNKRIAQVIVGLPVEGPFDYSVGKSLRDRIAVGQRVRMVFNRRPSIGVVVRFQKNSPFKPLNPVLSILDDYPSLDEKALKLTRAFGRYYGCSWGEAAQTWLPTALRKAKELQWTPCGEDKAEAPLGKKVILLHDKSPDKRWPFILETIRKVWEAKRRVIFLVPEASLIESVLQRLKEVSCPVIVLDKKMRSSRELEQWIKVKEGRATVVVGTRSAVFAPVSSLGLIVIYQEEHAAYKQEQSPHYRAQTIAQMRSQSEGCSLLYVSSAPSAETWHKAKKERWTKITYEPDRLSEMQPVDMTNYNPQRTSILSFPLQSAIQETLTAQGKVVLFMNRKGFSTQTRCPQCGWTLKCPRCDVNLTYLYVSKRMVCRHCSFKTELPGFCPHCPGSYLRSSGTGIEKLESEAARLYPHARISRYDRQTAEFPREADVVIATQAVLKGQGAFPVDLMAVVNFDAELHHMDFRSAQKAFALLVHLRQFAVRKLLVQTRMIDNYCLRAVLKGDFDGFYRKELKFRQELGFPPYKHLAAVGLRGSDEERVFEQAKDLYARLEKRKPQGIDVLDPHPDVNPKLRDKYRFTILLKGLSVKDILAYATPVIKDFKRRHSTLITLNVDP